MKMFTLLAMLISSIILFGCKSDSTESGSTPPTNNELKSYQLSVKVDEEAKVKLKNLTEIITGYDGFNGVEGELKVLGEKNVVWGLDNSENTLIAGVGKRGEPLILNAETTAVALVYTLLNVDLKQIDNIEEMIKNTQEFKNLKNEVSINIEQDKPIDNLANLKIYIEPIILELANEIFTQKSTSARAIPIDPSVETEVNPHLWVNEGIASIKIDSQKKKILSTFPIDMTVRNGNEEFVLTSSNFIQQFIAGGKEFNITGNTNETFELLVFESQTNYDNNVYNNIMDTLFPYISGDLDIIFKTNVFSRADDCRSILTSIKEKTTTLVDMVDSGKTITDDDRSNLLSTLVVEIPDKISTTADCIAPEFGTQISDSAIEYLELFMGVNANKIMEFGLLLNKGADAALSIQKSYFAIKYYFIQPSFITVCVDLNNKVSNCANSFEITPKELVLIPGDNITVELKAKTLGGKFTLIPYSISIDENIKPKFSSFSFGAQKNLIKILPKSIGYENFKVIDKLTEKSNTFNVDNIQPVFDNSNIVISPNELIDVKLVDSKSREIVYNNTDLFSFKTDDGSIASVVESNGLTAKIKGLKNGVALITATNKSTGNVSTTTVTVKAETFIISTTFDTYIVNIENLNSDIYEWNLMPNSLGTLVWVKKGLALPDCNSDYYPVGLDYEGNQVDFRFNPLTKMVNIYDREYDELVASGIYDPLTNHFEFSFIDQYSDDINGYTYTNKETEILTGTVDFSNKTLVFKDNYVLVNNNLIGGKSNLENYMITGTIESCKRKYEFKNIKYH